MMKRFTLYLAVAVLMAALAGPGVPAVAKNRPGANDLPLAAGLCVSRVSKLIQAVKPEEAILELSAFQAKAMDMNAAKAAKYGYSHYYIDFLLGNCLMMLEQNSAVQNQKTGDANLVRRAALAYEQAVAKQPELSPGWLNLAQCRYRLAERIPAAKAFLRGYETSDEKQAIHLYYAAACYFFAEQHKAALDTFERLLASHGDEVRLEWKEILVNTLFSLDRNREALPWLRELAMLSEGRKKKGWQEVLLYQYVTLEMETEALRYARFLTGSDPTEPKWWKSLTHIHLGKNRLEQGLQSLMIYGFLTPLSPTETALLADLYLACNIPLEAARYYEAWLARAPKVAEGDALEDRLDVDKIADRILKIANAYRQGGEPSKALDWIDKGLALKKEAGLLRLKADLLYRDKHYREASLTYEQLAGFESHRGMGCLMMGYAAWNSGQMEVAAEAFAKAVHYPKQKKSALSALALIEKTVARGQVSDRYPEGQSPYIYRP